MVINVPSSVCHWRLPVPASLQWLPRVANSLPRYATVWRAQEEFHRGARFPPAVPIYGYRRRTRRPHLHQTLVLSMAEHDHTWARVFGMARDAYPDEPDLAAIEAQDMYAAEERAANAR